MVSHKNHDHPEFLYWPRRRLIYWCLYHRQKLENSWIPAVMASHQCEGEQLHSSHVATFLCLMQMLWSWQFCFYPNFPASWCSPVAQTASLVRGACQQYNIILILNRKKKKNNPAAQQAASLLIAGLGAASCAMKGNSWKHGGSLLHIHPNVIWLLVINENPSETHRSHLVLQVPVTKRSLNVHFHKILTSCCILPTSCVNSVICSTQLPRWCPAPPSPQLGQRVFFENLWNPVVYIPGWRDFHVWWYILIITDQSDHFKSCILILSMSQNVKMRSCFHSKDHHIELILILGMKLHPPFCPEAASLRTGFAKLCAVTSKIKG